MAMGTRRQRQRQEELWYRRDLAEALTEKWSFPYFSSPDGGVLSTSSGVVFADDSDGNFIVLDAKTGRHLWHVQLGAAVYSTAITFELDGKQYVVIPAGSALFAFALPQP